MSTRKIGKSWWVDFRHNRIRYRKKSPDNSRAGALAYEQNLRKKLAAGEDIEARPSDRKLFRDFAQEWFDTYVIPQNKPSEQRTKRSILNTHLIPWFGRYELEEIGPLQVEQFKRFQQQSDKLKNKSINNHLAILGKCLRTAHEWGYLSCTPHIKPLRVDPPQIIFLTDEERKMLLSDIGDPTGQLMIQTALHTGMRLGELCALSWNDIDLERRMVTVCHSATRGTISSPKSNKVRHIPLTSDLHQILSSQKRRSGLVFEHQGKPMYEHRAEAILTSACMRTGVRRVTWHKLRHTFASQLAARGVPLRSIQILLGHSTIQMTERYAHLAPSSLKEAIAVLEESTQKEILGNGWAMKLKEPAQHEMYQALKMTVIANK